MSRRKHRREIDIGQWIENPPARRPKREVKGVLAILDHLAANEKSNREDCKR